VTVEPRDDARGSHAERDRRALRHHPHDHRRRRGRRHERGRAAPDGADGADPPAAGAVPRPTVVDQARRAQAAGNNAQAQDLYNEAVALDPDNVDALEGRRQVREVLGIRTEGGGSTLLNNEEARLRRIQQEVTYRFDNSIRTAQSRALAGGPDDFRAARVALDQARLARTSNPSAFRPRRSTPGTPASARPSW
jgi:hypothetical protein